MGKMKIIVGQKGGRGEDIIKEIGRICFSGKEWVEKNRTLWGIHPHPRETSGGRGRYNSVGENLKIRRPGRASIPAKKSLANKWNRKRKASNPPKGGEV